MGRSWFSHGQLTIIRQIPLGNESLSQHHVFYSKRAGALLSDCEEQQRK